MACGYVDFYRLPEDKISKQRITDSPGRKNDKIQETRSESFKKQGSIRQEMLEYSSLGRQGEGRPETQVRHQPGMNTQGQILVTWARRARAQAHTLNFCGIVDEELLSTSKYVECKLSSPQPIVL